MSKRDENKHVVALAYDGTDAVPLKVDPVTGRLLVDITLTTDAAYGATSKRDANKQNVALAVDSNEVVRPLIVDPTNEYLYVDVSGSGVDRARWIASASADGVAGDIEVAKPTGTIEGDIMFAHYHGYNSGTNTPSTPAGWTELGAATGSTTNHVALYYKVAGAAEPATYTFDWTNSMSVGILISTYRGGFDTSDPIDVVSTSDMKNESSQATANGITPSATGQPLLYFGSVFGNYRNAAGVWTPPAGYNKNAEVYLEASVFRDFCLCDCSKNFHTSGATGDVIATVSPPQSAYSAAWLVALNQT